MRNLIKVLLSIALVLIISASSAESKVLQARIPLDDIYDLYYDEINDMPVQSGNRYQISLALYLSPSQKDSGPHILFSSGSSGGCNRFRLYLPAKLRRA